MRSLDITAQMEAFFQNGGAVKQCPAGSAIRDDDGLSPRQIGEQTYAVMIDKERAK